MGFPIMRATVALAVLLSIGKTADGQNSPARLMLANGSVLNGTTYSLALSQDVSLQDGRAHIVREARLRFRFANGERIDDGRSRIAVVFDSARGAVSSPHGREVIDARRLVGQSLGLEYGHNGGEIEWTPPVPAIDFGAFGGPLPVSALIDFAFPAVGHALREGEQWETTVERQSIDGNSLTGEPVVARWTIVRLETTGGSTLAHVAFSVRRAGARTLHADGSFVVDAGTGLLLELSFEETVPGTWDFMGERLPFEQTTTLHIVADSISGGDEDDRP